MRKNARFMNNNFLENGFDYSSQLSAEFQAVNIYDTARSLVWMPGGNFEITASNCKLYINDGSDKTITLDEGSYTYSTLATHIQTKLNASSSNWECSYNSSTTFKFTINRTSGSATIRQTQTTGAVWDTLGYTQGTDVTPAPFVADEQRNHTSEWIALDCSIPQLATFAGLFGPIDEVFCLTSSATVYLQASNVNDDWANPTFELELDVGSLAAMGMLDDDLDTAYRYYRIEIFDRTNPLGPEGLVFGYGYIGDHVTTTNTNIATGFEKVLNDPSVVQSSEDGALFVSTRPRFLEINSAEIQYLSGTEYDELEQLFYDLGVRTPFVMSIDPGVEVSRRLEDMTRLMIMSAKPQMRHVLTDKYFVQFSMRESF